MSHAWPNGKDESDIRRRDTGWNLGELDRSMISEHGAQNSDTIGQDTVKGFNKEGKSKVM